MNNHRLQSQYLLRSLMTACLLSFSAMNATAHEPGARATYLANSAVMVASGETKVLFDPLFGEGFGIYPLVPAQTLTKIMKGQAPFDGIDAIFVSHVHGDHFAAADMIRYMQTHKDVHLFAPQQAITRMRDLAPEDMSIFERSSVFEIEPGGAPVQRSIDNIVVDAVPIPHAGNRPNIQNMVFRVTLDDRVTVMHMGDADTNDKDFAPYAAHWAARQTDHAFPPYWFFLDKKGQDILRQRINAKSFTGVHVPIKTPGQLHGGPNDYFSVPGESRQISTQEQEPSHE